MLCVYSCNVGNTTSKNNLNREITSDLSLASRIFPIDNIFKSGRDIMYNKDRVYLIKYIILTYIIHREDPDDDDFFSNITFLLRCSNLYFGLPDVASHKWLLKKENDKLCHKLSVYYFYIIYIRSCLAFTYLPDGFNVAFREWFIKKSNNDLSYVYLHPDELLNKLNSYGFLSDLESVLGCTCGMGYFDDYPVN